MIETDISSTSSTLKCKNKVAAIDFGSKNIKFCIGGIHDGRIVATLIKKENLNLAADLQLHQNHISKTKLRELEKVLVCFLRFCKENHVKQVIGAGTSALRSARNQKDVTRLIRTLGIDFNVIRGKHEGELAYLAATGGHPGFVVTDLGSRSFQVAYMKKNKLVAQSLKCGYQIAYEKFYRDANHFDDGHRLFRKLLKHYLHHLPQKNNQMVSLASLSLASHVTHKRKQAIAGQYLYEKAVISETRRLRKLSPKAFQQFKKDQSKVDKILPGLTFTDCIMELTNNHRTLIEQAELPVGLMVEFFRSKSAQRLSGRAASP